MADEKKPKRDRSKLRALAQEWRARGEPEKAAKLEALADAPELEPTESYDPAVGGGRG